MSLGRALGDFGCVIGKGLLAGLAGTAAITLAQEVEMALVMLPKVEVTPPGAGMAGPDAPHRGRDSPHLRHRRRGRV
jgi:hypothetical protein